METEENRYARHHLIDWWDQKRLSQARVMVVGAGAIGNEVIKNLALLGVGNLWVVDFDTVDVTNLTRSVLFRESDIGRSKAEVAVERARDINPQLSATALSCDLEYEIGAGVYRSMDVVIGCLDSLQARLALNRTCYQVGTPWINGGIEVTVAEVSLFQAGKGACFECSMSPSMWEQHHERFSCGGLRADVEEAKQPTTAVVASIVAGYMVNEAVALLHADSENSKTGLEFGQKMILLLKPYRFDIYGLPTDPNCLAHDYWESVEILPLSPSVLTTAQLLEQIGEPTGTLELGFDLLTVMRCVECGVEEQVFQPLEKTGVEESECPHCRKRSRYPETVTWIDSESEWAQTLLSQFGVPDCQIVCVKGKNGTRYIQLTGTFS